MGEIIKFTPKQTQALPSREGERHQRPEIVGPSYEDLLAQGGEAYAQLRGWKSRSIPEQDRIAMARNMDFLLNELRIKSKDLDWQGEPGKDKPSWEDRAAFYRDLSRMRYPVDADPGRRLMGFNTRWIDLLKMLSEVCEDRGENLTLFGLAERLTRGTRFHPVKQAQTPEEKQLYKLKLWANRVDEQSGLLRIFKRLSSLRAAYFSMHLRDYDETYVDTYRFDSVHLRPSDYFTDIPDDAEALFSWRLGYYTKENWDRFYQVIPEESKDQFKGYQTEIENWNASFDPENALFEKSQMGYKPLVIWAIGDFRYLPRFYIGRLDFDGCRLLQYYTKDTFPNGIGDPLLESKEPDPGAAYLVLYPTPELSRLMPYLLHFDEEGSFCLPLTEEMLGDDHWLYFPPDAASTGCPSASLLARIEQAGQAISTAWLDSANDLEGHPYFTWETDRAAMLDKELASMTAPRRLEDNTKQEDAEQ